MRQLCPYYVELGAQRALRSRFDDFHRALERGDRATLEVALIDFDSKSWIRGSPDMMADSEA